MKYVIIPVDQAEPARVVEATRETSLAVLQEAVGGYIEAVQFPDGHPFAGNILWLNEEGRALHLPLNARADDLVRGMLFPGDFIKGNVAISGDADGNGDSTDARKVVLEHFGLL